MGPLFGYFLRAIADDGTNQLAKVPLANGEGYSLPLVLPTGTSSQSLHPSAPARRIRK